MAPKHLAFSALINLILIFTLILTITSSSASGTALLDLKFHVTPSVFAIDGLQISTSYHSIRIRLSMTTPSAFSSLSSLPQQIGFTNCIIYTNPMSGLPYNDVLGQSMAPTFTEFIILTETTASSRSMQCEITTPYPVIIDAVVEVATTQNNYFFEGRFRGLSSHTPFSARSRAAYSNGVKELDVYLNGAEFLQDSSFRDVFTLNIQLAREESKFTFDQSEVRCYSGTLETLPSQTQIINAKLVLRYTQPKTYSIHFRDITNDNDIYSIIRCTIKYQIESAPTGGIMALNIWGDFTDQLSATIYNYNQKQIALNIMDDCQVPLELTSIAITTDIETIQLYCFNYKVNFINDGYLVLQFYILPTFRRQFQYPIAVTSCQIDSLPSLSSSITFDRQTGQTFVEFDPFTASQITPNLDLHCDVYFTPFPLLLSEFAHTEGLAHNVNPLPISTLYVYQSPTLMTGIPSIPHIPASIASFTNRVSIKVNPTVNSTAIKWNVSFQSHGVLQSPPRFSLLFTQIENL